MSEIAIPSSSCSMSPIRTSTRKATMPRRDARAHGRLRRQAGRLPLLQGWTLARERLDARGLFELAELDPRDFLAECGRRGLKGGAMGPHRIRFVTHYGVEAEHIQHALKGVDEVLARR